MSSPFISFYTPTYRRPQGLARCLASVQAQTAVDAIEQVVVADHVGVGIGGMFAHVERYASAMHGDYVHLLCDDDELADTDVVEAVQAFAQLSGFPPVILVNAIKGGLQWPTPNCWPPRLAEIDLSCMITRRDVWLQHVKDYGHRYEGDYDHMAAVARAGHRAAFCDVLFVIGGVSRGAAEAE